MSNKPTYILIEERARHLANGRHAQAEAIRKELDRRRSITTATFTRRPAKKRNPRLNWIG